MVRNQLEIGQILVEIGYKVNRNWLIGSFAKLVFIGRLKIKNHVELTLKLNFDSSW